MSNRLLDRQVRLLEFLTSGAAIFDDVDGAPLDRALGGIDCGLLRLEARFSFEKRMEKITAVFPRTFEMLEGQPQAMMREFVASYPPRDIGRLENARQFYDFLCGDCQRLMVLPPHLRDVAACELAIAQVRAQDLTRDARQHENTLQEAIRRARGAVLLRCSYDVRLIMEGRSGADPVERETLLGIALPVGADEPRIFELLPRSLACFLSWMNGPTRPHWSRRQNSTSSFRICQPADLSRCILENLCRRQVSAD
jgi:hypothetical protein